jgi:putative restriction endonuclease
MWERVTHYVRRTRGEDPPVGHRIGCIILTSPRFFPSSLQVAPPADWKPNIVSGSGYDLSAGEGKRIWAEGLERARAVDAFDEDLAYNLALLEEGVEFRERLSRVRLGQGGFRAVVTQAYSGTCAVSGDHTLPVLEAAHVRPVSEGGTHELSNGLLLRADIHRLYDRHLVTVTPDYEFEVSSRLREEYQNGRAYYAMAGTKIRLPEDEHAWPKRELLEAHRDRFVR